LHPVFCCRITAVSLVVCCALIFALPAQSQEPAQNAKQIKVGFIATLSGPRASIGQDALNGARLALEDLRAQYPSSPPGTIQLLIEDSQGSPLQGVNAYKKLAAQGAKLILTQNSNVSLPIASLVNNDNIVQLAFSTTADAYAKPDDLTFRINGSTLSDAKLMAEVLAKHLGSPPGNLALIVMEDQYPQSLAKNVVAQLAARNIAPKLTENFLPGENDFRTMIAKLKREEIKYIACLSYQTEAGFFVKQQKQLGLEPRLIITDTPVNNAEFFQIAGKDADGVLVTYLQYDKQHPANNKYAARYGKKVSWFAANGYDAVLVAHQALANCAFVPDAGCLKRALFSIKNFHGLSGQKAFDDTFGDMEDKYGILVARDGSFEEIAE
jgi:branched-chain amino acid transport system substrate-binding protein